MTCEWAEGYLSAYLDDALDPQLRQDVGAHIEQCAHCQALGESYRRNDQLLATLPTLAPPDQLRQRIFDSPAFASLARELEREAAKARPGRASVRRVPLYVGALASLAALLTISLGAALLFRQGLLPFGASTSGQRQTTTIGGPGSFDLPLAAGPRLVYLSDGALWSVAQYAPDSASGAPGLPHRLTGASVQVIAWTVSPLVGANGGARIAYVDARTGALHLIHSDGQADTIVGALSPTQSPSAAFWASRAGSAALAGLNWSPDGARLAYVIATPDGGSQARIYTLGAGDVGKLVATSQGALITHFTWSADGSRFAFIETNGNVASLVVWHGAGLPLTMLPASPSDPSASLARLAWSGQTLTWSLTRNGAITGVYALAADASQSALLTTPGASYSAADFTPAQGGIWLLAQNDTLSEARLSASGVSQVATLGATISGVSWSPTGAVAAVSQGDQFTFWSAANGLGARISGVAGISVLAWSPDSAALAVAQGQQVTVYRVSDGASTLVAQLPDSASALDWSADARSIAIAESHGVLLVARNGQSQTLLTSHPVSGSALSWSFAR